MLRDFRYALRTLRRSPGFAAVAILILGLGIGANTALFSTLDATVLRALPFPAPDRLVDLSTTSLKTGVSFATSWLDFQDWQDWSRQSHAFTGMAAYTSPYPGNLLGGAEPVQVQEIAATRGFFSILGVNPALGRTFSTTPRAPEAVISTALWLREFGASPSVLGRSLQIDHTPVTIVGVLPAAAALPQDADIWIPADLEPDTSARSAHNWPGVLARLRPGVSIAAAQAEMTAIAQRLAAQYPDSNGHEGIAVTSLQARLVGDSGFLLWLLLGAAGLVLLIACANLANLYLVRATGRQREAALRLALGASRAQLAQQWIAEGLLVALAGAALGLWIAAQAAGFLRVLMPTALPGSAPAGISWPMAAFALALALLTAALFAAAPAFQALPRRLAEQLKQSGSQSGGTRRQARTRHVLVVAEIALAMVVLAAAGLLLRSLRNLDALPLGFQPGQRVLAELSMSSANAPARWTAILEKLRANPAVRLVGAASNVPFTAYDSDYSFMIAGRPVQHAAGPYAFYHATTPGYFAAMGIPLLAGRAITENDGASAPPVAVIDQATAQLYWPGQSPLGQQVRFYGPDKPWRTIVGVVGNTQHGRFRTAPRQQIYLPYLQNAEHVGEMALIATAATGASGLGNQIRSTVRGVAPDVPVQISSLDALLSAATAAPRFRATLLSAFAGLAWLLAALGIYGVMAQEVARRRRELGIRIALGAAPTAVIGMILRQSLLLAAIGIAVGLALASLGTRLLASFLFQTSAGDPAVLALGAAALVATALLAALWPARRAARVSPLECLRAE